MWNVELTPVYIFDLLTNPSDFQLPDDLITMLRAYPWSQKNLLPRNLFDLISKTYTGKGLTRNYTKHSGNFERIWDRTSKQITCNMFMNSTEADQHQYYDDVMNLSYQHMSKVY